MSAIHRIARVILFSVMVLSTGVVRGQDYPNKPIRIVTPAGGAGDFVARLIAEKITGPLGQPIIVDGRSTVIAVETVAKEAPSDGYTLLVAGNSLWIGPLLQKMPYDPLRDFAPISLLDRAPNVLVVHPSLPVHSVKELITLAKAKPGELNYATGSIGSSDHLAAELFKSVAGVNITGINYKAQGPALNGVIGGEVQLMFNTASSAMPFVKSGRLTALGVTSAQPSALVPGVPPISATLPGYESGSLIGLLAPSNTPAMIVNRLNQEIVRVINRADMKERFMSLGAEPVGSSPEEFAATMKSDIAKWGKVIKDAGIHVE